KSYVHPGGETGTCALVLANLGVSVKLDGNHLGRNTYDRLNGFFNGLNIDTTSMTYDKEYDGLEDMVLIDKTTRTCFGRFHAYFSDPEYKRWNTPKKQDIQDAAVVGLDPFFFNESDMVAKYCNELGKKYVTIDSKYDSILHRYSSINVISNEFIKDNYKDQDIEQLFYKYAENTEGLVIFTFGARDVFYGRKGQGIKHFTPYKVKVESTLGAGDTFKAGAVYALLKGMNDDQTVSFASATAGTACTSYPIYLNPPTLEKIKMLQTGK
ncbi:MAG: PfkB family carbohydrate kinase, partial [Bacillota bacterium]|nr:PfkB family carbohydrate kinase [Bacillota bacterium]